MHLDPSIVLAQLRSAEAPVSITKLKKALGITKKSPITEADLLAAVASPGIFPWPKNTYWHLEPAAEILRRCSAMAMPKKEIKLVKGYPPKALAALIDGLIAESKLVECSALAGSKKVIFAASSPQAYRNFAEAIVAAELKKAGVAAAQLDEKILSILSQLEPEKDVPVSTVRVRRALGLQEGDKKHFDEAVLKLRERRLIYLSQHDHPLGLSVEDRDWLIDGGDGKFYVAITRREQ